MLLVSITFLGQFWNIPVEVSPFTGQLVSGEQATNHFLLHLTTPGSAPRSFIGFMYSLTWEGEEVPCLYVGDRQGGPTFEVNRSNDGAIAEMYSEYAVDGAFSQENYTFGLFNEDGCIKRGRHKV